MPSPSKDRDCRTHVLCGGAEMGANLSAVELVDADHCGSRCVDGSFKRDSECVPCNPSPCDTGQYRGACGAASDAECGPCTSAPEHSVHSGPGVPFDSDSCAWECSSGFFRGSGADCLPCNTGVCSIGEYRGACGMDADGACVDCTNSKPAYSVYVTGGVPSDADNCGWGCDVGFFQNADFSCTLCSALPGDASYTRAEAPGVDQCSWSCNAGHFLLDQGCAPCPLNSFKTSSGNESCAPCSFGSGATSSGSTACVCLAGFAPASAGGCEGCGTAACAAGQYRGPCTTSAQSVCLACTNAIPSGAVFAPLDAAACAWACEEGRELSGEACLLLASTAPAVAFTTPRPTAIAPSHVTVTFTAALQMSAAEFGGKRGGYVEGVAAALRRAASDVRIASVVQLGSRRRALSVLVETEVRVPAAEAAAVSSSVTVETLNSALASRGLTVSGVSDVKVLKTNGGEEETAGAASSDLAVIIGVAVAGAVVLIGTGVCIRVLRRNKTVVSEGRREPTVLEQIKLGALLAALDEVHVTAETNVARELGPVEVSDTLQVRGDHSTADEDSEDEVPAPSFDMGVALSIPEQGAGAFESLWAYGLEQRNGSLLGGGDCEGGGAAAGTAGAELRSVCGAAQPSTLMP